MCKELLNHRILSFEPNMTMTGIFGVFILFGTVTSDDEILGVVLKRLHNIT